MPHFPAGHPTPEALHQYLSPSCPLPRTRILSPHSTPRACPSQGKVVAIYFSATWCAPCKAFTPQLIALHESLRAQGKEFEVVFVSLDRTPEAFDQYFGSMPWLAVPFDHAEDRARLGQQLAVDSIPKLVVLDQEGGILTTNGRELVASDPDGAKFPWSAP